MRSKVDDPSSQYQKVDVYVPLDCRNDRLTREAESESESYVLAVTDVAAASIQDFALFVQIDVTKQGLTPYHTRNSM